MASQVTAKQFSPLRRVNLPIDSLHKMDRKHHEGLLKKMYMPFVRGPENRHFFASFEDKNSNSFLKFNPYSSPEANDYPLAPHRDDVPIINPCSGFLSPGAGADEKITPQRDGPDGRSPAKASVPHRRTQSAHIKPSLLSEELKLDRRWNSRALLDVALKARLTGKKITLLLLYSRFLNGKQQRGIMEGRERTKHSLVTPPPPKKNK